jgi:putative ATPase
MATAPKSRSATTAIGRAMTDVREARSLPIPKKLRDAHYAGAKRLGHGKADDDETYFGVEATYYEPSDQGQEAAVRQTMDRSDDDHKGNPNPE